MAPSLASASAVVFTLVVLGANAAPAAAQADRPNVVLIMTDDQGYGDFGVTGNPVLRTPNLDAMAARGARMTNFYVSPVCAPTRACLMTGRYNYRTRVVDTYIGRAMMEPAEVTIAESLRVAGYATGIFGKWHLGDCYPMRPIDQGFDEALVHRGGGIGQPSDPPGGEGRYTDAVLFHNGERAETEGYCSDVYFDAAMQWMEKQHRQKKPFFTYVATNCPHGPFRDVPKKEYDAYRAMNLGNEQFPQDRGHALPEKANADRRARIFAMIENVDANVGRLFGKLRELDAFDNTLVLFLVDNGPNGRRYVAGMRGKKSDVYEGGIRSPFFAHWPARLKAGHRNDRVAAHIDVLPTVLEACGVAHPEDARLDGRSLLPLLEGEEVSWPDRTICIQAHRGNEPLRYHNFAARNQRWKLLRASGFGREKPGADARFELYDMAADPLEMHDLAAAQPEVLAKMKKRYEEWFEDVSTTRIQNYAPPRIQLGTAFENPTVLTRQDWRRLSDDGGWQPGSRGFWWVTVASAGQYDVTLRFRKSTRKERATLEVGGDRFSAPIEAGTTTHVFEDIALAQGHGRLLAALVHDGGSRGAHHVVVRRR